MYYTGHRTDSKKFQCVITYRGRDTVVNCRVYPMVHMKHVSVDHRDWQKAYPAHMSCYFTMADDEQGYPVHPKEHDLSYIEDCVLKEWSLDQTAARMLAKRILA